MEKLLLKYHNFIQADEDSSKFYKVAKPLFWGGINFVFWLTVASYLINSSLWASVPLTGIACLLAVATAIHGIFIAGEQIEV